MTTDRELLELAALAVVDDACKSDTHDVYCLTPDVLRKLREALEAMK